MIHAPEVIRTPYGFVQRSMFVNADMHDEEISELVRPSTHTSTVLSSASSTAKTTVYTFLILGDQNAGKSTFLHCLTDAKNRDFTLLTSYLPILSSSFLNVRLLPLNDRSEPMDEPPFIDTDVGQGSVLLSSDDFLFMLNEINVPFPPPFSGGEDSSERWRDHPKYVLLQFLEIGGDHLDRILARHGPKQQTYSNSVDIVVNRSFGLIKKATKTIYFLNVGDILTNKDMQKHFVQILLERLQFLDSAVVSDHGVVVQLCRLPRDLSKGRIIEALTEIRRELHRYFRGRVSLQNLDEALQLVRSSPLWKVKPIVEDASAVAAETENVMKLNGEEPVVSFFHGIVQAICNELKNIYILGVYEGDHHSNVGNELVIHTPSVAATLGRLFQHQMSMDIGMEKKMVAELILNAYEDVSVRLEQETVLTMWMDTAHFYEYLEDQGNFLLIPAQRALECFETVARCLCRLNLALEHFSCGHSDVTFAIEEDTNISVYRLTSSADKHEYSIRFPARQDYLNVLREQFEQVGLDLQSIVEPNRRNGPLSLLFPPKSSSRDQLHSIRHELKEELHHLLRDDNLAGKGRTRCQDHHLIIWTLEDLFLLHSIEYTLGLQRTMTIAFDRTEIQKLAHALTNTGFETCQSCDGAEEDSSSFTLMVA